MREILKAIKEEIPAINHIGGSEYSVFVFVEEITAGDLAKLMKMLKAAGYKFSRMFAIGLPRYPSIPQIVLEFQKTEIVS